MALRILLLLIPAQACQDKQVLAPYLGIGKCLFQNKTCDAKIICVGCRDVNMTWTCKGVPDYHTIEIPPPYDTIFMESGTSMYLLVAVILIFALSPEFATGLMLGYMDGADDYVT